MDVVTVVSWWTPFIPWGAGIITIVGSWGAVFLTNKKSNESLEKSVQEKVTTLGTNLGFKIDQVERKVDRNSEKLEMIDANRNAIATITDISKNAREKLIEMEINNRENLINVVINGLKKLQDCAEEFLKIGIDNIDAGVVDDRLNYFMTGGNKYAAAVLGDEFVEKYFKQAHKTNKELLRKNLHELKDPDNMRNIINRKDARMVKYFCTFGENNCADLIQCWKQYSRHKGIYKAKPVNHV